MKLNVEEKKVCKNCGELKSRKEFAKKQINCKKCDFVINKTNRIKRAIREGKNRKGVLSWKTIKNDGCHFKEETRDVLVRDEKINGVWFTIYPSKV